MDSTQVSSIDSIELALSSSSTAAVRKDLSRSFGGEWSDDEEATESNDIIKELFENKLINESSKCFLIKSRAYNDNIIDALMPAIAIKMQVKIYSLFRLNKMIYTKMIYILSKK